MDNSQKTDMNPNLYLYILMRNDLPSQGAGRAAAQASHAANAFIYKYGKNAANPEIGDWQSQTPQGFGTAIVLSANLYDISQVVDKAAVSNFPSEIVIDPDYVVPISSELVPYISTKDKDVKLEPHPADPAKYLFHRSEPTCAYIFGDKTKLKDIVGDFPLYS